MTAEQKERYLYLNDSYYGEGRDVRIEFRSVRIVKTRLVHDCAVDFLHSIPAGSFAVSDTARSEGRVGTCYTCLPCLDAWAKEIQYDAERNNSDDHNQREIPEMAS